MSAELLKLNSALKYSNHGRKKRANVGKAKQSKVSKLMIITNAADLPLSVYTDSASPHEVIDTETALTETLTVLRARD